MTTTTVAAAPHLARETFTLRRELEFFSEKELQLQIGHPRPLWPLALVKELIDNALDACETAGTAPELSVTVAPDSVAVQDNGPGLPAATLSRSLDYLVRVSDKQAYVSPTRGQLGNALKCLWAAPFVHTGGQGMVTVETAGVVHTVAVTLDRIAQVPRLSHATAPGSMVNSGTGVTLHWPEIAGYLDGSDPACFSLEVGDLPELLRGYSLCNPHAAFTLQGPGTALVLPATTPAWSKLRPSDPTSPHWYGVEQLRTLIAAYLSSERADGRARTVRDLAGEFSGLSGTGKRKAVTAAAGLAGAWPHDLVVDGDVDSTTVARLLAAMQAASRPLRPEALGVLGAAQLTRQLVAAYDAAPDSVSYRKALGTVDGLPYVLEVAFGITDRRHQRIVALNNAPVLRSPLPRLGDLLAEARVHRADPVVLAVHLACPRLAYLDRGKTQLQLPPPIQAALAQAVAGTTKAFTAAKRQADRQDRLDQQTWVRLRQQHRPTVLTINAAATQVMAEAYQHASDDGRLPANARQIMYAARPHILALTGGKLWSQDSYFTQHLLPDYLEAHPEATRGWDVVFDARGHLTEPHTGVRIDLGTLDVRAYVQRWRSVFTEYPQFSLPSDLPTDGPEHRYRAVLFIEKEGFLALLQAGRVAERHDLALMSTKGMSVTAARTLVAALSAQGVTILVARDLDKSGFSIMDTLAHDTRRFHYATPPRVVDLGLRLDDAEAMGLAREPVSYEGTIDPRLLLRRCGATEAECDLLVQGQGAGGQWYGERIELNAMTSRQFLDWLEQKLDEAGVQKVIPAADALAQAYRRAVRLRQLQSVLAQGAGDTNQPAVPVGLDEQVAAVLAAQPTLAWDAAVWQLSGRDTAPEPAAGAATAEHDETTKGSHS